MQSFYVKVCGTYSNRFPLESSSKENVFIFLGLFKDAVQAQAIKS
jgi:hypothetical protein